MIYCKNVVKIVCTFHFSKKKKIVEWNCGNDIAEIGGKKICSNWFMAMSLPKLRGKKCGNEFVAISLLKQDEKKIVAIGLW